MPKPAPRTQQAKYDPADDVINAITHIITLATPKNTVRGREARNRLVKTVMPAVKEMLYKKEKGKA